MHSRLLVSAAMAASVFATPGLQTSDSVPIIPDHALFQLTGRRADNSLEYSPITAGGRTLVANYAADFINDTCDSPDTPGWYTATLFLDNGTLNLYTPSNISQRFYTHELYGTPQFVTLPDEEDLVRDEALLSHGWELVPTVEGSELELMFKGFETFACSNISVSDDTWDYYPFFVAMDTGSGSDWPDMEYCRLFSVYASAVANEPHACTYSTSPP
ncbi:hypothetical protein N0V82_007260 [Gnomoniopsis sp. IMI 355080]|nr:hypothetical protein N0V82_007260 [Gnomoniopsis sp. IMI 355080]